MNVSGVWQNIKEIWKPVAKHSLAKETDQAINDIAPERIKRSPGHDNLNEIDNEPEWSQG